MGNFQPPDLGKLRAPLTRTDRRARLRLVVETVQADGTTARQALDLSWVGEKWWPLLTGRTAHDPTSAEVDRRYFEICLFTQVVNELKSAGAEAISINGQRVVYSTAVRCVGPVAQINDSKKSSPFVITAIGDSETLLSAMNLANGVLDNIRKYDPFMAGAEKQASVKVPAFSGSIQMKYAQTPKKESSEANK